MKLARRGRVRIALTREGDTYLTLDERAAIARRLGACAVPRHPRRQRAQCRRARRNRLFAFRSRERRGCGDARRTPERGRGGGQRPRRLAPRLALRPRHPRRDGLPAPTSPCASCAKAKNGVLLRPEPHRFAAFRVLRRSGAPAVLFEAGYMSKPRTRRCCSIPINAGRIVKALARAIEAEAAVKR